jgi:uncharacterized protein (TIGR02996 family)
MLYQTVRELHYAVEAAPDDATLRRAFADALEDASLPKEARFQRLVVEHGESKGSAILIREELALLNAEMVQVLTTEDERELPPGWVVLVESDGGRSFLRGRDALEILRAVAVPNEWNAMGAIGEFCHDEDDGPLDHEDDLDEDEEEYLDDIPDRTNARMRRGQPV